MESRYNSPCWRSSQPKLGIGKPPRKTASPEDLVSTVCPPLSPALLGVCVGMGQYTNRWVPRPGLDKHKLAGPGSEK